MGKDWSTGKGKTYPLGASVENDGINFAFVSENPCEVVFYNADTEERVCKVAFPKQYRIGNVWSMRVSVPKQGQWMYQIMAEDEVMINPYIRHMKGHKIYGQSIDEKELYDCIQRQEYDWGKDTNPKIPYEDCIVYCMHVRGFTRHVSSKVKNKGTYAGIVEKISYLKELGITTLELMPAYEFLEKELPRKKTTMPISYTENEYKLNYWGYKEGYYYTPKNNYAAGEDSATEFKDMIRELHKNGMEAVMQFYFPKTAKQRDILDILKYWRLEYHVDGFHIKGENLPMQLIAQEPVFADTKLWNEEFNDAAGIRHLAIYQDDYMNDMRRFLKGDEGMIATALRQMRKNPTDKGVINFFTNYDSLTMQDMVSYERKHNELNGEENRDGREYNYSWNCGAEGMSRKKSVVLLRERQVRNALCMLFFSQGTPLLYQGDEFGNSQEGNNNPYGLDDKISWLNWKDLEKNKELFFYVKDLISIRKKHPILHMPGELRIMDYRALGYPDLSYHGTNAWNPQTESYNRHVAIMYCGKYAKKAKEKEDDFFFMTLNMHWEVHEFALPTLPKGMNWYQFLDTKNADIAENGQILSNQQKVETDARSIQIYIGR